MTPVHLPEVPESAWLHEIPVDAPVYTAAQLRAYATEAVMAERAALSRLADRWRRAADWLESSPMAVTQSGDLQVRTYRNLADELDAITQPEQNSGR